MYCRFMIYVWGWPPEDLGSVYLELCWPTRHFCIVGVWWILLNPGLEKSNIQTPSPLLSFSPRRGRGIQSYHLAAACLPACLPAKHAQTPNPITFLITGASWLFRALCFIWDFTFPSLLLDMAHPAASNQVAEGSSAAGWVFRLHLDLRIAHHSHWPR